MSGPGRRKLPFRPWPPEAWPAGDRARWAAARAAGDPLEAAGVAALWSAGTAAQTALSYGGWLAWLAARGALEAGVAPAARLSRERVGAYRADLAAFLAPSTVALRLRRLHLAVQVMQPGAELGWLGAAARRLQAAAAPQRAKQPRLVASGQLWQAGLDLLAQAETAVIGSPRRRALVYRDGLLVAFLAVRPVRVGNLAALRLDRHLLFEETTVQVRFAASEMKTGRGLEFAWPAVLLAPLRIYLAVHRPVLLAGSASAQLWLGRGGPLTVSGCQQAIRAATRRCFGWAIPPHFFRDCAATTIAQEQPEQARIIATILGHASPRTAERYYTHAGSLLAGRRHQQLVRRLRQEGQPAPHRREQE